MGIEISPYTWMTVRDGELVKKVLLCVQRKLSAQDYTALRARVASFGGTAFTDLLAAYGLMLHELTVREDLVIGTTSVGRHIPGSESMIGVFVNPLPLRILVEPDVDLVTYLKRVNETTMELQRNSRYPMADLVQRVEPFRRLGLNDTLHVYLLLQNFPLAQTSGEREYEVLEPDGQITRAPYRCIQEESLMHDQATSWGVDRCL